MFFLHFMLFPTFLETNYSGNYFLFFLNRRYMVNFNMKFKWKVVSPDSRYRETGNLYPIYIKN